MRRALFAVLLMTGCVTGPSWEAVDFGDGKYFIEAYGERCTVADKVAFIHRKARELCGGKFKFTPAQDAVQVGIVSGNVVCDDAPAVADADDE